MTRRLVLFACVAVGAAASVYISWTTNRAATERWKRCSDLVANAKGEIEGKPSPTPVYRQDIIDCVADLPDGRLKTEAQALLDTGFVKGEGR